MSPPRRKKWSETEEKTLIDKYGEMVSEGALAKMKTREKKFRPIALYVNLIHHEQDPAAYPWEWSWKDVSTKVQNMRHQYLLVKQKIKKPEMEEFEWGEGVSYWSNFLRYKDVFGDFAIEDEYKGEENFNGDDGLAYEEAEANESRRKKKAWGFVASQVKELQTWLEQREADRQKKIEDSEREKTSKRVRRQWAEEWEGMEKAREARRREEMLIEERDWEQRMNQRRCEWTKTMDEMLSHHKAEMGQLQSRLLDEQQSLVAQLLGVVSQWTSHPTALSDRTSATNHYLSQMMHHVNGMIHHDSRVGDNQDDQFIVDG